MHDDESTHLLVEEIRSLRTTVYRFGVYFVILSLLPILWAVLMMALMGSALGGLAGGFTSAMNTTTAAFQTAGTGPELKVKQQAETISQLREEVDALHQQVLTKNAALRKSTLEAAPSHPMPRFDTPTVRRAVPVSE